MDDGVKWMCWMIECAICNMVAFTHLTITYHVNATMLQIMPCRLEW